MHNLALTYHIVHRAVTAARSALVEWIAISLQTEAGGFCRLCLSNFTECLSSLMKLFFQALNFPPHLKLVEPLKLSLAVHMYGHRNILAKNRAKFLQWPWGGGAVLMWPRPQSYLIVREERKGLLLSPPGRKGILFLLWESVMNWESICHCPFIALVLVSTFHVNYPNFVHFCYWHLCCYSSFSYPVAVPSKLFLSQPLPFVSHQKEQGRGLWLKNGFPNITPT